MKKLLNIFFLLLLNTVIFSQTSFDAKSLLTPRTGKQKLVNDFAGVLTPDQQQALESKLVQFDDSTSHKLPWLSFPILMVMM